MAGALRFLRQPSSPNVATPPAKSGSAAGSGVSAGGPMAPPGFWPSKKAMCESPNAALPGGFSRHKLPPNPEEHVLHVPEVVPSATSVKNQLPPAAISTYFGN